MITILFTAVINAAHKGRNRYLCRAATPGSHVSPGTSMINYTLHNERELLIQEMLNQARHQAEGQVSAKECELMQFKLDLSKHQQQVRPHLFDKLAWT